MDSIIKIVTSLEESSLLIKDISETNQNESKEQKAVCIAMLSDRLDITTTLNR